MASRVYVIELAPGAGRRRDLRIPWVYVGSSARDPEIRFAQHRRGYKSAGIVKRFALRLRPDLYEDLPGFRGSKTAQRAEVQRAEDLAGCGFVAHCDGTSYGKEGGVWQEWGEERLGPIAEHFEAAALELREAAFEPPDLDAWTGLLRGERGFWVGSFLDPSDPPPAYGQFAHFSEAAVKQQLRGL